MTLETSIYRIVDHHQVEEPITVEFKYYRASRGARDGRCGPPIEPDDPAEIEIVDVYNSITRHEIDLSRKEEEDVLQQCWDEVDL
jgi:hypothetical protein